MFTKSSIEWLFSLRFDMKIRYCIQNYCSGILLFAVVSLKYIARVRKFGEFSKLVRSEGEALNEESGTRLISNYRCGRGPEILRCTLTLEIS